MISYGGGSISGAGYGKFTLGTITGLATRQTATPSNSGTAITLTFSAQTSANQTQDIIDGKLDKRRKGVYGPPMGQHSVIFVDDLNMPKKDTFGSQPPLELLRQWLDYGGWYDRAKQAWRYIVDMQLVVAMGPPGGGPLRLRGGKPIPLKKEGDADAAVACCVGPTLLGTGSAAGSDASDRVHDTEVFGPVATLVPYRNNDLDHALQLIRRGQGSLVASVYGSDPAALAHAIPELTDSHGRVHVISPDVAALHTGHGNVMPQSLHGGPGRAGGGEELGGLRALNFYHRRAAIQASTAVLTQLK